MPSSSAALAVLWVVWLASWLLASGWTARTVAQQSAGSRLMQSLPIWVGVLIAARPPTAMLRASLYSPRSWAGWTACVLAALGFAFTWWARLHLGRFWSAAVTLKAEHALVRSGPYGITRHPIYTGLLFAVLASAFERNTVAALLGFALITLGLVMKLREEESLLRGQFGQAYEIYMKDVPALVPRPW